MLSVSSVGLLKHRTSQAGECVPDADASSCGYLVLVGPARDGKSFCSPRTSKHPLFKDSGLKSH